LGHKVHPVGFRLGIVKDWDAHWFAEKDYTRLLHEDIELRALINRDLRDAGVPRIEVERSANQVTITIHTAKPGIVIGKNGAKVEELRRRLEKMTSKKVRVNINEVRQPELDATLVARSIAEQLERRVAFRRAMKQAVGRTMQRGAKGVKAIIAGRLGGAEMSRREREVSGKVPLHTLRADIDFGTAEALTTFGVIGVKVWIYKGEILPRPKIAQIQNTVVPAPAVPTPVEAPA
jgi:small subunit ribosomal protein S3